MPSDTLSAAARLQDIRLRVVNNERVTPDEFRTLLDDIRRDRTSAARTKASEGRARAKSTQVQSFDLDSLFGARK